jgi:hypothetical protein
MLQQVQFALHASIVRVLTKVAMLLPAVIALFVAVLACCLIGIFLAFLLRRLLAAVRFDERVLSGPPSVVLEWSAVRSPALLLSRAVFWVFAVAGVVIGVAAFAAAYSDSDQIATALFPYVMRVVGAALLLLAGTIAARFLARSALIGAVNMNLQSAHLLSQGVKWMVVVLTVAMVFDHLSVGGRIVDLAFGILFGGIVLTLALAIGLHSPELVTRSFEHDSSRPPVGQQSQKVRHL